MSQIIRISRYRQTTLLIAGCCALLAGLGTARVLPPVSGIIAAGCAVAALGLYRPKNELTLVAVLLLGFMIGWWRGGIVFEQLKRYDDFKGQTVTVLVTAETDSAYDKKLQISFMGSDVQVVAPYSQPLVGKITAGGFGERMIYRGDRVQVTGRFYMTRGSKVASISFGELTTIKRSTSKINAFQRRFAAGMQNALPEPQASFAMGLLIGSKSGLDADTTATLSAIGLTHIIAVSGYNLTIIIRAMRKILGRFSKYQMLIASGMLIIGFLAITGLGASIVRASIVSGLSLLGWYYGRPVRPLLLILFTAAITALWNPLYVWSDIGWYLSFLAFAGVMIAAPLIQSRMTRGREPKLVAAIVFESLAAQLMTLPFILYIFGYSSLISLPANVLVVPLIPLAMAISFLAGMAGMIIPELAGWFSWPGRLLLTYILDVATLLERVPHMRLVGSLNIWHVIGLYCSGIFCLRAIWKKTASHANITEVDTQQLPNYKGA